jgi:hypothetical protein
VNILSKVNSFQKGEWLALLQSMNQHSGKAQEDAVYFGVCAIETGKKGS